MQFSILTLSTLLASASSFMMTPTAQRSTAMRASEFSDPDCKGLFTGWSSIIKVNISNPIRIPLPFPPQSATVSLVPFPLSASSVS